MLELHAILRLENIWGYLTIYAISCGYLFIAVIFKQLDVYISI
jgi:hypothetical protein